jgi:hypothetical protein
LAKLPVDNDFDSSGAAQTLAYHRAWWFARFVAETYGVTTLRSLYVRAGNAGHPDAAMAMTEVLHAGCAPNASVAACPFSSMRGHSH